MKITEVVDTFRSGLWQAEVGKRHDGEHYLVFGFGQELNEIDDLYQGPEVRSLLGLMQQITAFLEQPMPEVK